MDLTFAIADYIIENLKCSLCKNHLSYFPIFLMNEGENVCGRCSIPKRKVGFRNKVFEEVAKHLKFPCRYQRHGCCEELLPENAPSHEKDCHFKTVRCPGKEFITCSWKGPCKSMLSHCRYAHKDVFLKDNGFELNSKHTENFQFLEYNETLFIVWTKHEYNNKALIYSIYHVEHTMNLSNYSYQLFLSKDKGNVIVENVTTTFFERTWSEICFDSLITYNVEKSGFTIILDEFFPINVKIVFEENVANILTLGNGFNEDLLSLLKCAECEIYVLPPVHQFEDNKIRCEKCGRGNSSRNVCLDKVAKRLNYPCRYVRNGCNVVLKSGKMNKHLLNCSFEDRSCPYCDWIGIMKNFKKHILELHEEFVLEKDADMWSGCGGIFMIFYEDYSFQLKYSKSPNCHEWIVNGLDYVDNFWYQIEIIDSKDNRLLIQRKCLRTNQKEDNEEEDDNRGKENESGDSEGGRVSEETVCKIHKGNKIFYRQSDEFIHFKASIVKG